MKSFRYGSSWGLVTLSRDYPAYGFDLIANRYHLALTIKAHRRRLTAKFNVYRLVRRFTR